MSSVLWNDNWRFYREQAEEAPFLTQSRKNQESEGYAARLFNDNTWEKVTLPHDWAIGLEYFERASRSHGHFPTTTQAMDGEAPGRAAFTRVPTGGWYRKTFFVPDEWREKRVIIEFEGVFRDAHVWINGQYFDRYESGYMGFKCDVTDNLYFGANNVIAVRADSRELEGWWYEGAGIYRNVRLTVKPAFHLDALNIRTSADMYGNFILSGEAVNDGEKAAEGSVSWILSRNGKTVLEGESKVSDGAPAFGCSAKIDDPDLWSTDEPNLYELTVTLGEDTERMNIGFRSFRFDADNGLFVNEKPVKIKGCCIHQDFAGVGVALPDGLQEYKIKRLKDMGANAYRSSHNAPAPEIVDACDRLGMLLMDETRMFGSSPAALRDTVNLVKRDRNHPCVLMWSIGNEEHSVQNTEVGARLARSVMRAIRNEDDTRVITYGGNNAENYDGVNAEVDVRGVNYIHIRKYNFADEYHALHPHQPMYGSEEASSVSARGEYKWSIPYATEYGEYGMPWASTAEGWWKYYCERSFMAGGFIWTGFDYFGEPTPYERNVSTSFGAIDLCGFPKDVYYYYTAWWKNEPSLHLFPHWNFEDGENVRVMVYTNLDEAELFVNGKSLGRQKNDYLGHIEWQAEFEAGTLEAVGYKDGKAVLTEKRVTAGKAAKIVLSAEDSAPGSDVKLIRAEIVDANGITVPDADNELTFSVMGGKLLGVGNGDPACRERNLYPDTVKRREVLEWYKGIGRIPYNAFTVRGEEHYNLHAIAHTWIPDENKEPFRDRVRIVGRPVNVPCEESFTGYYDSKTDEDALLEFTRLEGKYSVKLNGELLGEGDNKGYPCGFEAHFAKGRNVIEVTCKDANDAGGIFSGVYVTTVQSKPWKRSAFHALALAIVRSDGNAEIEVTAEGLEGARIRA